ncbi:uroporphyrinogen-III C-methyltransferase [Rhodalgimonas zhirmunskyi]|uniref:uroporphyrinogen-III C-methyltransferase n=1 Tax=Rhodalgimonas zhirmunskyi TaxID=2964767 RepID=A0AAJ1U871_9RHOB|nr:uroporphyrinogen-III C-methyltransferase [Rhodoalgimonas zhirmunskyi]MDQ2095131.1 uroporphyrinogen-III C-methyltransferase [Rhodoalgimonas zhirmunskyi]
MKDLTRGKVFLIGAGPGDPDLLTVKALKAMQAADVVVYDRLVSPEIMALVPDHVERIDVGKMPKRHKVPQEQINDILVKLARQGQRVVRLKGGDPLIFGRGSEEAEELREAGVPYEYVPGITSAQGTAASTGVPLTHRGLATGVRYVTGHRARDASLDLDWASLACEETTLVIYMGAMNIADIAANLMRHGMPATLPVMAVASVTTPRERRLISTLATVADDFEADPLAAPVLFFVGHVVSLYESAALPLKVAAYA